jgi:predicted DNA-binding protein (UPF0251 family)
MARVIDGTKVASHGLFYMEGAGGSSVEVADAEAAALRVEDAAALRLEDAAALRLEDAAALRLEDERQPSCFALEEERGEAWKGGGAMVAERDRNLKNSQRNV